MKKVGILTYHSSDNYGSVLQAYALHKYLSDFCDAQIIDYRKSEVKNLYKIFKPMNCKFNIITNLYNVLYYRRLNNRKKGFEAFRKKFLNLSQRELNQKAELDEVVNGYDALVCGSDQVWNFDIVDFDTSFLLDFPEFSGKKIAYAASMGPKKKSKEQVAEYKWLFEEFDGISVREESAAEVLSDVLEKPIDTVIDPVFLLSKEEWTGLIEDTETRDEKEDYVFCYFPGGVSKSLEKFSRDLAKKLNCKRVLVVSEWRNIFRPGKKMYDCMPVEFISMIKNAKAVCTSSFHGTAFSIIMGTPFYVEMASGTFDSRIAKLLSVTNNIDSAINSEVCGVQKSEKTLQETIEFSKKKIKDWII